MRSLYKIFLITCLILSCNLSFALGQNMWQTRDQQGSKLLSQGKAKQAATIFKDNHWQGVSQFKSAQYKKAVKTFNSLPQTAKSFYNLGNALAHTGSYEKAVDAYKKSLKLNPNDKDALHNKKILEDLIKKQQKQNKKNQNKKDQNKKDQDKKDQNKKDQNKKDQNKKDQDKKDQDKKDQDKKDQDKKDQDKKDQDKKDQDRKSQNKAQKNKNREKNEAQKQQLKRVPDNPGGLLKQKFMRDYIKRHPQQRWY